MKGSAIFIRLGNRNRHYRDGAKIHIPFLKDIIFENIQGTRISSQYPGIIAGINDISVENIIMKNINLEFEGGGNVDIAERDIPENETNYPNGKMFGELPAYGFYVRHVKNLTFDNVQLRFKEKDERPALFFDNVEGLKIKGLEVQSTPETPELIRLINSKNVMISESRLLNPVKAFVSVYGGESEEILLLNNRLRNVDVITKFYDGASKDIINEKGTIK